MKGVAKCPECGREYRVGPEHAGKRFACRACPAIVTVPGELSEFDEPFVDEPVEPLPRRVALPPRPSAPTGESSGLSEPLRELPCEIRFKCPMCQTPYKAADTEAGKRYTCPSCDHRGVVPADAAARASLRDLVALVADRLWWAGLFLVLILIVLILLLINTSYYEVRPVR